MSCFGESVRGSVGNGVQAPIVTERPKRSGYCLNVKNGVTDRSGQNAAATDGT